MYNKDNRYFNDKHWIRRQNNIYKAIIDHYGESFFADKTILSLGCGYGDIELKLINFNVHKLILSDARKEFLKYINKNYLMPNISTVRVDLDSNWEIIGDFDLVFCIGVLYHTIRPDIVLSKICRLSKHLFLETEYLDSDKDYIVSCLIDKKENNLNHNINKVGCRPSYGMLERILKNHNFTINKITNGYNSIEHLYDTGVTNTNGICPKTFRVMWACEKNEV